MLSSLTTLVVIAAAVGFPLYMFLKKPAPGASLTMLDELSSKLKDINLVQLQSWVDTLEGITYDRRLALLSGILHLVNAEMHPTPPPAVIPTK